MYHGLGGCFQKREFANRHAALDHLHLLLSLVVALIHRQARPVVTSRHQVQHLYTAVALRQVALQLHLYHTRALRRALRHQYQ